MQFRNVAIMDMFVCAFRINKNVIKIYHYWIQQSRYLGSRNVNEIYQRCYICIINCHKILFSSNWKKLICTSKISSIQGSRKSIRALGQYLSTNVEDNWSIHTYRKICFLILIWKGKKKYHYIGMKEIFFYKFLLCSKKLMLTK